MVLWVNVPYDVAKQKYPAGVEQVEAEIRAAYRSKLRDDPFDQFEWQVWAGGNSYRVSALGKRHTYKLFRISNLYGEKS
jgi:hypothetical protein